MPQTVTIEVLGNTEQSHYLTLVRNVSGTYTIVGGTVFICDTTSGSFTITLPPAATNAGRLIVFKKIVAAGTLTIDGNGSETIDGATTVPITTQYASVNVVSDGTNWIII